nr:retrovirus-related Pol polyprotein from transposon TNT 1-94 [Tanacetum cinerariifolium]
MLTDLRLLLKGGFLSKTNQLNVFMQCDIKKPIWYLDSGCSRHMTCVKSYLHKYIEYLGPKVVFGDDSTCTTKGYGSIKCNGPKVMFGDNSTCTTEGYGSIKCNVYIHNHKDLLGKFDGKANDDFLLGYSLVSKAFRVFNIIRQQTEETYHITFDESPDAIKFSKPSVGNINIAETERYPPDECLHPYEPSQRAFIKCDVIGFFSLLSYNVKDSEGLGNKQVREDQ